MPTDRLSPTDTMWLYMETPDAFMHAGGVVVLEGLPFDYERSISEIESTFEAIPRFRQKLVKVPFGLGRPVWVDDARFDVRHHVRHIALPEPATDEMLLDLTSEILSAPLDHTRPLWEQWLVSGLGPNRYAAIFKMHHCILDGVAAVNMFRPFVPTEEIQTLPPFNPRPQPSRRQLVVDALRDRGAEVASLFEGRRRGPKQKRPKSGGGGSRLKTLIDLTREIFSSAPETPLNVTIGPYRRHAYVASSLTEMKRIRTYFGGTVNDVALSALAGGLRDWLIKRGTDVSGQELKLSMPVNARTEGEEQELGNMLSVMAISLPVHEPDPVKRLELINRSTTQAKKTGQKDAGNLLFASLRIWAWGVARIARKMMHSSRQFNISLTNVAGVPAPPPPRKAALLLPMPILMPNMALACAVISMGEQVWFGLVADYDAVSDVEVVSEGIRRSLDELSERAGEPAS